MSENWRQFREQPAACKVLWLLLYAGAGFLWTGFFSHSTWQNVTGCGLIVAVFVLAALGLRLRPALFSGFAGGLFVNLLVGIPLLLLLLALLGLVCLVAGFIHGFTLAGVLNMLHFAGVLWGTSMVLSLGTSVRTIAQAGDRSEATR